MAIISNQANTKLKLVYNAGVDDNNKTITKSKTFANMKPTAQNESLYNLGVYISGLQAYALSSVLRYDEYELINEI